MTYARKLPGWSNAEPTITNTAATRVTLVGGLGDGQTIILNPAHRRWLCWAEPSSEPTTIPGAQVIRWEQYSPDADGVWRPIDQYHPLYLI